MVFLSDFIFPKKCLGCGKNATYICAPCVSRVKFAKQFCIECERPSIDGMTHVGCQKKLSIRSCFSLWKHQGVVRKSLIKLKYGFASDLVCELSSVFLRTLRKRDVILPKNALLVPIPLHKKRENWRGFNQTEKVGRLISSKFGWGFAPKMLFRSKQTTPQTELKRDKRVKNLLGVFAFDQTHRTLLDEHKSLVLFDDVLTTGATLRESAKVLRRNGALEVWGLTMVGRSFKQDVV